MNSIECIKGRRSIRSYQNTPVTEETVAKIVEAASYAPSWKNSQTTRYTLVLNPEIKKAISENCLMDFTFNQKNVNGAPAVVVVSTVDNRSGYERDGSFTTSKGTHWQSFDSGIATEAFCLAAHELGVATLIMGVFDADKVKETVHLPENQSVSALLCIGYADEAPEAPKRKTVEELLTVL